VPAAVLIALAEIAAALSDERGGGVKELLRTPWRREIQEYWENDGRWVK
jgi:hypothetical protein